MNIYDLDCRYDSRASFYGKAKVIEENGVTKLLSYDTIVAEINKGVLSIHGLYSNTTLRHIREFIKQFYGDSPLTLKELREHMGE